MTNTTDWRKKKGSPQICKGQWPQNVNVATFHGASANEDIETVLTALNENKVLKERVMFLLDRCIGAGVFGAFADGWDESWEKMVEQIEDEKAICK